MQRHGTGVADDPQYPYVGKYVKDLTLAQIKTIDCGSQRLAGFSSQVRIKARRFRPFARASTWSNRTAPTR